MPYSATPPKPAIALEPSGSSRARRCRESARMARARRVRPPPRLAGGSGSIFSVDAHDRYARVLRKGSARNRTEPMPATSTRFPLAALGYGIRRFSGFQRVRARRFRSPRQLEHVFQGACFSLRISTGPASGRCRHSCSRCRGGGLSPHHNGLSMVMIASAPTACLPFWLMEFGDLFVRVGIRRAFAEYAFLERRFASARRAFSHAALSSIESFPCSGHQMQYALREARPSVHVPGSVNAKPSRLRSFSFGRRYVLLTRFIVDKCRDDRFGSSLCGALKRTPARCFARPAALCAAHAA